MKMSSSNLVWLKYYNICVIFFLFKLPKDLFQAWGEKFQWDTICISSYISTQFLHTSCHAKLKRFCPNNIAMFLSYYIYGPSTPFFSTIFNTTWISIKSEICSWFQEGIQNLLFFLALFLKGYSLFAGDCWLRHYF